MKHHLFSAIIMALCLVPITSHAYDFSAVNDDGLTICYDIISEEEKTCKVTRYYPGLYYDFLERTYPIDFCGDLRIPQYANEYKVVSIAEWAFYKCSGLTSITIPSSVTKIEYMAFFGCSGLTSIDIPSSVISIGGEAFSYCSVLTSITIPSSVTSIGTALFHNSGLTSIIVESGNSVYDSRNNCNAIIETATNTLIAGINNTKIPSSVTSIGELAFFACRGLISIDIPSSVTSIGENAFEHCANLTSVTIPSSVTSIGNYAFYGCKSLSSITIPSSVTSIGVAAFSGCTSLSTVYCKITNFFDIDKFVFSGSENATLYVPKGMANTYRSSKGWSVIKYIKEMPDDTPDASFLISCSNRGSVSINGAPSITNKISAANINEGTDNTFTFTPKPNCRLDQVILNGLDITANVQGNTLTCTIPANSQMIVTFTTEQGDINNDGRIDISDVVTIVNKILGN